MAIQSFEILNQIKPEDRNLLNPEERQNSFGNENDFIELHVYDSIDQRVLSLPNFTNYNLPELLTENTETFNEIIINPDNVLRNLGFNQGSYNIILNCLRQEIGPNIENAFYIETISPSRTEIRARLLPEFENRSIQNQINALALTYDTEDGGAERYFKDFALNFDKNIILTGVNFIIESDKNFLIKLYEPIPVNIIEKTPFRIVNELIDPIKYKINLEPPEVDLNTIELKGPNLRIDTRLNSSVPTTYKTYNDILRYSSTSSLNDVINVLSQSIPISVEYGNPNTDSGFTFEKFTHFGSAEEKIRNFNYKLELIELYTSKSAIVEDVTNYTLIPSLVIERQNNINLKNKVINDFNNFERFLYFESGTYSWPKSNSVKPYINSPTTSSEVLTWIGSIDPNSVYYGGQLLSASLFDQQNPYILRNTLPTYIIDNPQNSEAITFTDMLGQYFDDIWIYIENITDKNFANNDLNQGISKDLVFNALQERGIPAFDQFENSNLFEYLLGENGEGNYQYQAPISQSMISASNADSIPKGDIAKEVWKRLYHNAPYLLQTKGTERGIKALMACYGIPETILHVKEYGGPTTTLSGIRTFSYKKHSKMASPAAGLTVMSDTLIPNTTKTLQVRFLPTKGPTTAFDIMAITPPTSNNDVVIGISQSIDPTKGINSGSFAHLVIASGSLADSSAGRIKAISSSLLGPIFNGEVWNLSVRLNSGSSEGNTVEAFATNTALDKSIYVLSCSIELPNFFTDLTADANTVVAGNSNPIGSHTTLGTLINPFTGSIQEYRAWTEKLTKNTIVTQSLSPFNYNGNNVSSSFESLIQRLSLGSNNQTIVSGQQNQAPNPTMHSLHLANIVAGTTAIPIEETHHLTTPDTVGSTMVSEKVRFDSGSVNDNILSPFIMSEESTLDRQPLDYSTLGVFFSPTFEINEDIVNTLGPFSMDDFIGDPRHLVSGSYPDLKALRDTYNQKLSERYDFFDYIKAIQYIDHTLFKVIEQFIPAKANLKSGLVIEPHYLERNKFNFGNPDFSQISIQDANYIGTGSISGEYILHETDINMISVFDGSGGNIENNFVYAPYSSKYYRIVSQYNHQGEDTTITDNTGTTVTPDFNNVTRTSDAINEITNPPAPASEFEGA
tara:strand:- start:4410 stop:7805 length:3396 start_codon:yes stop_codon:yes gene_type:complete